MTVIDPSAPLRCVRAHEKKFDEAIDWNHTSREKYRRSRDLSSLKLHDEDKKPVLFCIRRLPATFYSRRIEGADTGLLNELGVRAGVFAVEMPNGDVLRPKSTSTVDGVELADEDWYNDLKRKFGLLPLLEMAGVTVRFAQLADDESGPFT